MGVKFRVQEVSPHVPFHYCHNKLGYEEMHVLSNNHNNLYFPAVQLQPSQTFQWRIK